MMITWRPEGWNSEDIAKKNMPLFKWGTSEYAVIIRGIDIGAEAMLEALRAMAEEQMSAEQRLAELMGEAMRGKGDARVFWLAIPMK